MSLFYIDESDELNELVQRMSKRQYELSPHLYDNLSDRAKRFMKRDYFYAISYLKVSMDLNQPTIFVSYIRWTYEYLGYLMTYMSKEKKDEQIRDFYVAMDNCLSYELNKQEYELAKEYIDLGLQEIDRLCKSDYATETLNGSTPLFERKIQEYISMVLRKDSKSAISFFIDLYNEGMDIDDIYIEVAQKIMIRTGQLWFENKITVAQEHYCTALTQTALAQLYPIIFSTDPNGLTMIGCCIGGELHEMGMRMITDLFAYRGWNSVFLGAGVPEEALLTSAKEQRPELVALSVTMPQHLMLCKRVIETLKDNYPNIKIAVGGRAFDDIPGLWKKWGADILTTDARELIKWAKTNIQ